MYIEISFKFVKAFWKGNMVFYNKLIFWLSFWHLGSCKLVFLEVSHTFLTCTCKRKRLPGILICTKLNANMKAKTLVYYRKPS